MEKDVLWEGLKLLVLGMGGVFVFLAVLIQFMKISAAFFIKFAHLFPDEAPAGAKKTAANANEEEQIAVAIAAIKAKM